MGKNSAYATELRLKYSKLCETSKYSNPIVSIIVPAYNVANYIERCLLSLVQQSFKNIEIIVIDDGSEDMTSEIIDAFGSMDSRLVVIHQQNRGVSAARNKGIEISKGEYIAFVDSDDYVDENFIFNLHEAITKYDCDISVATIIRKRSKSQKYRVHYTEEKIYSTLEEKIEICKIPNCCYIWNKLYKKEVIKDFKFKEGVFFEDILWIPEVLKQSGKLVTVPNINYYYRVNNNSIVKKLPSSKKQEDCYLAKKYIVDFFNENNLKLSQKEKILTHEIKYFLNIPFLKIKEFDNLKTYYLFNLIPIKRENLEKKFLVFNTACFGDVLICNTLIQNIKANYPNSKIIFITDKNWTDVAKYQKDVDEVIFYDKKGEHKGVKGLIKFISQFPYKDINASFITYRNVRNLVVSFLLGAKKIVQGNNSKKLKENMHMRHANLLSKYSNVEIKNLPLKYQAPLVSLEKFDRYLDLNTKYIVLCTLTKNPPKDMPINYAIELINQINSNTNFKIVYIGIGNSSQIYADKLKSAGCNIIDLTNKTSLIELANIINKSQMLISVDTGTMHLGYSLGIKTLCLFFENGTKEIWAPNEEYYNNVKIYQNPPISEVLKEVNYAN